MYQAPFSLTEPVGNNAFSYEKRTSPSVTVPSAIDGSFSDVRRGTETVFEDFDENGILRSCAGLEHFVRMVYSPPGESHGLAVERGMKGDREIPMIVFDNHNHALYFWYEALANGTIGRGATLVHIDEHSDLWENENSLTPDPSPSSADLRSSEERGVNTVPLLLLKEKGLGDEADSESQKIPPTPLIKGGDEVRGGGIPLESVFHFTNYQCNVGNYIQPALREGLIGKMLRIEDTIGMGKYASYQKSAEESLILNLDLDFFAPELDYIPFEDKKRLIRHFARQAQLITVATSPFFIDQDRAIAMLGRVFGFPRA